ncbi:hypothetical protein N476_20955 [Pseudoalteromonas luteoviolacea H33]|uniref:Uncharacterized protein n=1 Tax=Pseudoalteromonas luteoviolacea H33 TaxID=1365251 RepID=A0A167DCZ6_9GAMM|nr:hypothetical protein N476_20955 [Pseudoalteromonas luteoviolacea H33]KZN75480.1 hypothetical protein N477_01830 [Pseudoalteromonas luteoviolacea H33-S]
MIKLNKKTVLKVIGGSKSSGPHTTAQTEVVFGSASQCRTCHEPPETK